jgi:hypothetical protein
LTNRRLSARLNWDDAIDQILIPSALTVEAAKHSPWRQDCPIPLVASYPVSSSVDSQKRKVNYEIFQQLARFRSARGEHASVDELRHTSAMS